MTLPFFFNKTGVNQLKKKKPTDTGSDTTTSTSSATKESLYPTLSSLLKRASNISLHEPISTPNVRAATPTSIATRTSLSATTEAEQFIIEQTAGAAALSIDDNEAQEEEDIDENFFYKHLITHFHPLFVESTIVCIPHTKSIQGLVLTRDIIESHCFMPSPYFCGQYMATKRRNKNIALDYPLITTLTGYQKERIVHILAEETVSYKHKKIRLFLIDRLLEGEAPKHYHRQQHKPTITIPPVRNSKNDLEFLNMFPENSESIYGLQLAVQEFTDSYVYVKGYNKSTVERIQHMYMKAYKTILKRNPLFEETCRTPSEHDRFLELVENVVMSFLYKKIWKQSLQSLLASQDNQIRHLCQLYSNVNLSQFALRYPISEMDRSCFQQAIDSFQRLNSRQYISVLDPHTAPSSASHEAAFTPLEKLATLKATLDIIQDTVTLFVNEQNNSAVATRKMDASLTSDELIPLLAYIVIQSQVDRIASMIYYIQHYRLARMVEGSVYNFVLTTMKSACEFLKHDPLSLQQKYQQQQLDLETLYENASPLLTSNRRGKRPSSIYSMRSVRSAAAYSTSSNQTAAADLSSTSSTKLLQHRKSQSADLSSTMSTLSSSTLNSNVKKKASSSPAATSTFGSNNPTLRPHHFVLPQAQSIAQHRKSLDWVLSSTARAHDTSMHTHNSYHSIPSPASPSSTVSSISTTASPLSPTTQSLSPSLGPQKKPPFYNHLNSSRPLISTTFPSLSSSTPLLNSNSNDQDDNENHTDNNQDSIPLYIDIPKLGRSLSASTNSSNTNVHPSQPASKTPRYDDTTTTTATNNKNGRYYYRKAPTVINININRLSYLPEQHHQRPRQYRNNRPASICLDTRSFQHLASSSNNHHSQTYSCRRTNSKSKSNSNSCNSSVYSVDHAEDNHHVDAISIKTSASAASYSSASSAASSASSTTSSAPTTKEELMGDFLLGLSQLDGNVVGGRSGTFRTTTTPTTATTASTTTTTSFKSK